MPAAFLACGKKIGFAMRKVDSHPGAGAFRVRKTEGVSVFGAKSALFFGRRRRPASISMGRRMDGRLALPNSNPQKRGTSLRRSL